MKYRIAIWAASRVQNRPEHRATGASKTLRNAGKLATIAYLEKSAGWRFESSPVTI
jgi:hypothetical protein